MIREQYGNDGGKVSFFLELFVFSDRFLRTFCNKFCRIEKVWQGEGDSHLFLTIFVTQNKIE